MSVFFLLLPNYKYVLFYFEVVVTSSKIYSKDPSSLEFKQRNSSSSADAAVVAAARAAVVAAARAAVVAAARAAVVAAARAAVVAVAIDSTLPDYSGVWLFFGGLFLSLHKCTGNYFPSNVCSECYWEFS